jgi:hypothetical protein
MENIGDRYQATCNPGQSGMQNFGEQEKTEPEAVNINTATSYYYYYCCYYNYKLYSCFYKYYNSICLKEGRRLDHYELSALAYDKVRSLWQQGKFLARYCEHRNTTSGKDHETNLQHSDNLPAGSFHCENNCITPADAGMSKVKSNGKFYIRSKSRKKPKEQDLRIQVLKSNLKRLLMSDKKERVRLRLKAIAASSVVSSWARDADNELRALFLSKGHD